MTARGIHSFDKFVRRERMKREQTGWKFPIALILIVALPVLPGTTSPAYGRAFSYCVDGSCLVNTREKMSQWYGVPPTVDHTCARDNHYALTFDDGPGEHWPNLLDILEHQGFTATDRLLRSGFIAGSPGCRLRREIETIARRENSCAGRHVKPAVVPRAVPGLCVSTG